MQSGEMMENILDILDKLCSDNHVLAIGIILVIAAFILSFAFKTAWGTWIKRKQ